MENENYENYLTTTSEGLDINAHNIEVECITSSKNKFSLDCDGNLTVNSINFSSSENNILSFDAIFNKIYPVGAIYISANEVNPGTLFTGVWEKIEGKFLLASNNSVTAYALGSTGGAVSHTHTSAAQSHGAANVANGSMYAAMAVKGTSGLRYKTVTGINFTPNERKADGGAGYNYSTNQTEGVQINGATASTTPGNTGSSSNMPPFLSVNVWKRIS